MRKWNDYDKEYDEFDYAYEQATMMVHAIDEVRKLRKENEYLKEELSKGEKKINNQYKQSISQVGNILNGLIDRAEKEKGRHYE